ncbi:MAG: L-histidine N(alpha)-methyltransferase [Rhodanobacteraceae bacterium]|jgi:dimethylhistidine N-methyltransferase|nr:L-histidine N(alpha)-methyltransferase [Rhodanobacteraceae bacterium]
MPLHPATRLRDEAATTAEFAADVRAGLARRPKRIASKWLYDARGSALFERICTLPEYYLTRTELAILREHAGAIGAALGPQPLLVEYGSGSGTKTRLLLEALQDPVGYVPIELSRSALADSIERVADAFPQLAVLPLCADFTAPLALPAPPRRPRRVVVFFPGSTLGNFDTREAVALLARMRRTIGAGGAALVGIDLRKDRATLEAAYNDAAGVTAQFTLNLLARMNRELGADFDLDRFRHRARWNALAGRIETHIVSSVEQQVRVGGRRVHFTAGEAMLVEYSCKYTQAGFERIAARAGLRVECSWSDPDGAFALELLRPP